MQYYVITDVIGKLAVRHKNKSRSPWSEIIMSKYFLVLFIFWGCASKVIEYQDAQLISIDENAFKSFVDTIINGAQTQRDSLLASKPNPFSPTSIIIFRVNKDSCPVSITMESESGTLSTKIFEGILNEGSFKILFPNEGVVRRIAFLVMKMDTTVLRQVFNIGDK